MISVMIECGEAVNRGLVEQVVAYSGLPDGQLLVLAGTPDLEDLGGACIPRFLLPLTFSEPFAQRSHGHWQVGVAISPRMCRLGRSHPAFFVQILAHELSHARVVLSDPELHVYCAFLDRFIREASANEITQWHELPHEQAHDAYGIWMASQLVGADVLQTDLGALLEDPTRQDHGRLRFLQSLSPRASISKLRDEVRSFARPFSKALYRIWDREFSAAEMHEAPSITQHASHIRDFLR